MIRDREKVVKLNTILMPIYYVQFSYTVKKGQTVHRIEAIGIYEKRDIDKQTKRQSEKNIQKRRPASWHNNNSLKKKE